MAAVSPFDRAAIAGKPEGISRAAFKTAVQAAATECPVGSVPRWRAALDSVAARYEELHMRLPATVNIACTDGTDAGDAVYTRGNTVFMPRAMGAYAGASLFAHELFHIFSRHNPAVASKLYAQIGFTPAPPLQWPAEWIDARISNPDAPFDRHTIRAETPKGAYSVMPLMVARRTALQPGETFFSVLDVRLLAVVPAADGKASLPLRQNGQLVWFDANTTESYLRQLGGNTPYIVHPEETMADNIMLLVTGRTARNPALIERLRNVLTASATSLK